MVAAFLHIFLFIFAVFSKQCPLDVTNQNIQVDSIYHDQKIQKDSFQKIQSDSIQADSNHHDQKIQADSIQEEAATRIQRQFRRHFFRNRLAKHIGNKEIQKKWRPKSSDATDLSEFFANKEEKYIRARAHAKMSAEVYHPRESMKKVIAGDRSNFVLDENFFQNGFNTEKYAVYYSEKEKEAVLVLRGSIAEFADWGADNIRLVLKTFACNSAGRPSDSVNLAEKFIGKYKPLGYKTFVTGHSLGGTIALLVTDCVEGFTGGSVFNAGCGLGENRKGRLVDVFKIVGDWLSYMGKEARPHFFAPRKNLSPHALENFL